MDLIGIDDSCQRKIVWIEVDVDVLQKNVYRRNKEGRLGGRARKSKNDLGKESKDYKSKMGAGSKSLIISFLS